jgi:hypothetical protein
MSAEKIAPMWQVGKLMYHYSDEYRAKLKGSPKLVWVAMNKDYFIGTVQIAQQFANAVFEAENDAENYIKNRRKDS